jgi:hypothetical protein
MKALITSVLLILFILPSYASYLPPCPEGIYHNCFGTHSFEGDKYVGEFKDNLWHGQGTLTWANGNKYVGEFKDGKWHGKGAFTSARGFSYVGEYKDNKITGKGTFTLASGTVKSGIWADDEYLYDLAEHRRREENNARTECAKEAGKANTEYAAKKIEEACLEQKGYGKAWYEW